MKGKGCAEGCKEGRQTQMNAMCDRLDAIRDTLRQAKEMAFAFAKEGDGKSIRQMRGAMSGVKELAEETECFLYVLKDLVG